MLEYKMRRMAAALFDQGPAVDNGKAGKSLFFSDETLSIFESRMAEGNELVDFNALPHEQKQFLNQLHEAFERIPVAEKEVLEGKVEQFLNGEISWAEFDSYPPELLFEIAKIGQHYLNLNRFDEALTIFHGLTILDHKNYFYRGVLGSIYQKKKAYVDALTQYSLAVELNPKDIPSYTNRGECWLLLGAYGDAKADFEMALSLASTAPDGTLNKWVNRARVLHKNVLGKINTPRVLH